MIVTWIGYTAFNAEQDFLGCSPDGHVWVYLRGWGDFFITFHIVMVFFQASQGMSVFWRIPRSFGYFDPVKNTFHKMDENTDGIRRRQESSNDEKSFGVKLKNAFGNFAQDTS